MFAIFSINGDVTLLFLTWELIQLELTSCRLLFPGYQRKEEDFISKLFLSLQQQFIVLFDDIHFGSIFLKVKGMRTVQVFFEDCVASS